MVGDDCVYDIIAVARPNGYLRILQMSDKDIDAAAIDPVTPGV